jgi:hypothetical protein
MSCNANVDKFNELFELLTMDGKLATLCRYFVVVKLNALGFDLENTTKDIVIEESMVIEELIETNRDSDWAKRIPLIKREINKGFRKMFKGNVCYLDEQKLNEINNYLMQKVLIHIIFEGVR